MAETTLSYEEHLYALPPSRFINAVTEGVYGEAITDPVVDLGSCNGRNSRHLARLGHSVVGVTIELQEALAARHLSQEEGLEHCNFVAGDIRHLTFRPAVGTILINEVLHIMPKAQSNRVLEAARQLSAPRGLHLVSGYMIPRHSALPHHRLLRPNELSKNYKSAGWEVLEYTEEIEASIRGNSGALEPTTLAAIIARKPAA